MRDRGFEIKKYREEEREQRETAKGRSIPF